MYAIRSYYESVNEIAVLEKQVKDKEALAERQMVRGVVESVLSDVAAQSTASSYNFV